MKNNRDESTVNQTRLSFQPDEVESNEENRRDAWFFKTWRPQAMQLVLKVVEADQAVASNIIEKAARSGYRAWNRMQRKKHAKALEVILQAKLLVELEPPKITSAMLRMQPGATMILERETHKLFVQAIVAVDEENRRPWYMFRCWGYRHKQIAALLSLKSSDICKERCSRVNTFLAEILSGLHPKFEGRIETLRFDNVMRRKTLSLKPQAPK